ncbi:MAG: hypothetical protein AB7P37_04170 [Ramlibacter sp.]
MRISIKPRVPRPRNPVIRALIRRVAGLAVGRHRPARARSRKHAGKDLDELVREMGEW